MVHELEQPRPRSLQIRAVLPPGVDRDHAPGIRGLATRAIARHARISDRSEHTELLGRPVDDDVVEEATGVQIPGHAEGAADRLDSQRSAIACTEDRRAGRREADRIAARPEPGEAELRPDRRPFFGGQWRGGRSSSGGRPGIPGGSSGPSGLGVKSCSVSMASASGRKTFPMRSAKREVDGIGSNSFQEILGRNEDIAARRAGHREQPASDRRAGPVAPHRSHVMAVLQRVQPNMRRWCILGAGHLHDVALSELIGRGREREREISLVDVDEGTVTAALTRADARRNRPVASCPATDLTGVLELLDHVTAGTVDANRVMAAIAAHVTEVPAPHST